MDERAVFPVNWILAWTRNPLNRRKRPVSVLFRSAFIVAPAGRVSSNDEKVGARLQAPVPHPRRKNRDITFYKTESLSLNAAELNFGGSARNAEDFMSTRMIMSIAVDAVAP